MAGCGGGNGVGSAEASREAPQAATKVGGSWANWGGNVRNTRSAADTRIDAANVGTLVKLWDALPSGDVSATPTSDGRSVYFPDWAGFVYKVDARTGAQQWRLALDQVTGIPDVRSRTSVAVADGIAVFGTQSGGLLVAVDAETGATRWITSLGQYFADVITQSPTIHGGRIYVGTASLEESLATFIPGYPCCFSQGRMSAIDLRTGAVLWSTRMTIDGYSGAGIWGSAPAVDVVRKSVYIATGNNYNVPQEVKDCAATMPLTEAGACMDPFNLVDAVVALDLDSGALKWATRLQGYDAWWVSCIVIPGVIWPGAPCPSPAGPDYDFAQAPALLRTMGSNGKPRELVGVGQKSGVYRALDPDTGAIVWSNQVGPGGTLGGLQWGSASDGKRVYVALSNNDRYTYTLHGSGRKSDRGGYAALDAATGAFVWQIEDPHLDRVTAPTTVANGVVFGCSMSANADFTAFDAATGAVLWKHAVGGSCNGGAAVLDGIVYWGSGYANLGLGTGKPGLSAFALPK